MAAHDELRELRELRKQYFSLYPAIFLRLPSSSQLSSESGQRYLVESILRDEQLSHKGKEPERGYRKQFWKRVIKDLETGVHARVEAGEDLELDERLYEAYTELMVSSTPGAMQQGPQASYKTFIYEAPSETGGPWEERMITLYEEQVTVQAGSTGLRTWTASLHLAHHILQNPTLICSAGVKDIEIFEIGAGTGFLSIFLAQRGARVISTDLGDEPSGEIEGEKRTPLESLRYNVSLNALPNRPDVQAMDWFDSLRPVESQPASFRHLIKGSNESTRTGVIVAADVIYDPSIVPALVSTILCLLAYRSHALIAATVRNQATLALFISSCHEAGMRVIHLDLQPMSTECPTFYDSGAMGISEEVKVFRLERV